MARPGLIGKVFGKVYWRRQFSGAGLIVAEAVAIGKNHSGSSRSAPVRVPRHGQGHSPHPLQVRELLSLFGGERNGQACPRGPSPRSILGAARLCDQRLLSVVPDPVGRLFFNRGGQASASQCDCSGTIALTLPVTESGQQLSLHFGRTGAEIIRPNVRAKDHTGDKGLPDLGDPLAVGL